MYKYIATSTRVHRIIVDEGKAFKMEQCNLEGWWFRLFQDVAPEGTKCGHCWKGWVEPTTEEEKQAAAAEEQNVKPPPGAKGMTAISSTRRLAAATLIAAGLAGLIAGVIFSPDVANAEPTELADLKDRMDGLFIEVRILQEQVTGHTHQETSVVPAPTPIVIVLPTPTRSFGPSQPTPTPPIEIPVIPTPTDSGDTTRRTVTESTETRTIIVVPAPQPVVTPRPVPTTTPTPTAPPTPFPTPEDCFRPGIAGGVRDRCKWPQN